MKFEIFDTEIQLYSFVKYFLSWEKYKKKIYLSEI